MHGSRNKSRAAERGISLAEVLVAVTVLALAMAVSLVLYDGARRSFKVGSNLAEQQQVVRIAFDKLSRDLAMAGFNHNPDGLKARPDEAIEAAFDGAIVIRADFDETAELNLDDGAFPTISTGNDEIVGYALAKADGSSTDALTFAADVEEVPRDGTVESIDLDGIATPQSDPPYTLYRFVVADGSSTVTRIPLVDNVRRLRFTYYDAAGSAMTAPGGADDAAGRTSRAAIHRIGVEIEGLTRDPDLRWTDTDDTDPDTRGYRKFELFGDVTPPNLGLVGRQDLGSSLAPPSQPALPTLHPGHCEGLYITWSPNPPQDAVARYEVRYGTDEFALGGPVYSETSELYLSGLVDATQYYVSIQAVDDSGNLSAPSAVASAVTNNDIDLNKPAQVPNAVATTQEENHIQVSWDPVLDNVVPASPGADPTYPAMRDFAFYRIHGSSFQGFPLDSSTLLSEQGSTSYVDSEVMNCEPYFYRIIAVDRCDLPGDPTPEIEGRSRATVISDPPPVYALPAAPINVRADPDPGGVRVSWDAVTIDTQSKPIYILYYTVYRADLAEPTPSYTLLHTLTGGETVWLDPAPVGSPSYRVQAADACPNYSALSESAEPTCTFVGDVQIVQPGFGVVDPDSTIQIVLSGGSGSYDLTVTYVYGGSPLLSMPYGTGPPWAVTTWPSSLTSVGLYRIDAVVTQQSDGCTMTRSVFVWLENNG